MDGKFRNSFFVMEFNSRIVAKCVFSSSGKTVKTMVTAL